MSATFETRGSEDVEDLDGERHGDDAAAHRKDIGIVMSPRQGCHVRVVAQGRADAGHLVGGDLLTLTAPAKHDAPIRLPGGHRFPDGNAMWRVIGGRPSVSPQVGDPVAAVAERPGQLVFQIKSGVIGPKGDASTEPDRQAMSSTAAARRRHRGIIARPWCPRPTSTRRRPGTVSVRYRAAEPSSARGSRTC